ncbi:MAG: hypothetical protein NVS4B6_22540 [Mycobacterium sp.]
MLDVRCDPDVPPIPPHATFGQAKSLAHAVLGGDENAAGFTKQGVKQKVQQYFPSEKDRSRIRCAPPYTRSAPGRAGLSGPQAVGAQLAPDSAFDAAPTTAAA